MQNHLPILGGAPQTGAEAGPTEATPDAAEAARKLEALEEALGPRVREGVLVAFSGGMDSAFLLWAAHRVQLREGGRVVALTTTSASTPARDKEDAIRFTESLSVEHLWRESQEVSLPQYVQNDRERCYHCKTELFRIAGRVSEELTLAWLLYGFNVSDHGDFRPGHRAAEENNVLSPLSDVGLTKSEIRLLMEEEGLELSDKPASPCLSSRIMTGIEITPQRLRDVEEMEEILRQGGISVLRVRVCRDESGTDFIRVEVPPEEMAAVLGVSEKLQQEGLARGYRWVTLDLGGYQTGGGVT